MDTNKGHKRIGSGGSFREGLGSALAWFSNSGTGNSSSDNERTAETTHPFGMRRRSKSATEQVAVTATRHNPSEIRAVDVSTSSSPPPQRPRRPPFESRPGPPLVPHVPDSPPAPVEHSGWSYSSAAGTVGSSAPAPQPYNRYTLASLPEDDDDDPGSVQHDSSALWLAGSQVYDGDMFGWRNRPFDLQPRDYGTDNPLRDSLVSPLNVTPPRKPVSGTRIPEEVEEERSDSRAGDRQRQVIWADGQLNVTDPSAIPRDTSPTHAEEAGLPEYEFPGPQHLTQQQPASSAFRSSVQDSEVEDWSRTWGATRAAPPPPIGLGAYRRTSDPMVYSPTNALDSQGDRARDVVTSHSAPRATPLGYGETGNSMRYSPDNGAQDGNHQAQDLGSTPLGPPRGDRAPPPPPLLDVNGYRPTSVPMIYSPGSEILSDKYRHRGRTSSRSSSRKKGTICGMSTRCACCLLILLVVVVLGVALGVGLGVGLKTIDGSSSSSNSDSASETSSSSSSTASSTGSSTSSTSSTSSSSSASSTTSTTMTTSTIPSTSSTTTSSSSTSSASTTEYNSALQTTTGSESCPSVNNKIYPIPGSQKSFQWQCGIDYVGPYKSVDIGTVYTSDMEECMVNCAGYAGCTACSWGVIEGDPGPDHRCWLKTNITDGGSQDIGDWQFAILQPWGPELSQ